MTAYLISLNALRENVRLLLEPLIDRLALQFLKLQEIDLLLQVPILRLTLQVLQILPLLLLLVLLVSDILLAQQPPPPLFHLLQLIFHLLSCQRIISVRLRCRGGSGCATQINCRPVILRVLRDHQASCGIILDGDEHSAIVPLGHDHLPLPENVIRSHLCEALLACDDVVELGLRVEQIFGDRPPGELLLPLKVIVDVEVLEGVVTEEAALVLDDVEDLPYRSLLLEVLAYRVQRDLLPFLLIEIDLAV